MQLGILSSTNSVAELFTLIIIWIIVCVIAYYTSKFIATYQNGCAKVANIEVIETYRLTNNKYIQIIRTGEKYSAIAVCKDNITFICELTEDEIVKVTQTSQASFASFKDMFEKLNKNKKTKKQADEDE